jgi:hypothetical protein
MRPVPRISFFLILLLPLLSGCGRRSARADVSGIELVMTVERFDRELFQMDQEQMETSIGALYERYGDFFDVFNVHVINIGPASARRYPTYLSMFINDPTNREVFEHTAGIFTDMAATNEQLTGGFKHYLYHFPGAAVPRVVGYVSRFNQGLFTVSDFVGVGLDQYLGADSEYYQLMGTPRYLARNKVPERIPLDVMMAFATERFPFNDSVDNALNRIIHKGKLRWFVHTMFPDIDDGMLMGFTEEQMKWCRNNEKQMWTYLVEHKLLFETDPMTIRKLSEDAPYTQYFTTESPGRAVNWQGLQIVREYVRRNPQLSVSQIMAQRDYQDILSGSRYNP